MATGRRSGPTARARRIASDRGYEDIFKVRRVGISYVPLIVVILILSLIVYLVVK